MVTNYKFIGFAVVLGLLGACDESSSDEGLATAGLGSDGGDSGIDKKKKKKKNNNNDSDDGGGDEQGGSDGAGDEGGTTGDGGMITVGMGPFLTTMPPDATPVHDTNTTGAAATGAVVQPVNPEFLIDDLEDGDAIIIDEYAPTGAPTRVGVWYTYNDETSVEQSPAMGAPFLPTPGGPNGSQWAAHTMGMGFSNWGAGMGFDINNPGGTVLGALNATERGYTGVTFMIRGQGTVVFKVNSAPVVPVAAGGQCSGECYFATGIQITLTDAWTQQVVPWSMLNDGSFDPTTIMALQWQVTTSAPFEINVDDVAFY